MFIKNVFSSFTKSQQLIALLSLALDTLRLRQHNSNQYCSTKIFLKSCAHISGQVWQSHTIYCYAPISWVHVGTSFLRFIACKQVHYILYIYFINYLLIKLFFTYFLFIYYLLPLLNDCTILCSYLFVWCVRTPGLPSKMLVGYCLLVLVLAAPRECQLCCRSHFGFLQVLQDFLGCMVLFAGV